MNSRGKNNSAGFNSCLDWNLSDLHSVLIFDKDDLLDILGVWLAGDWNLPKFNRADSFGNLWWWHSAEVKDPPRTNFVSIMCFSWSFLFTSWRSEGTCRVPVNNKQPDDLAAVESGWGPSVMDRSPGVQSFEVIMVTAPCDMLNQALWAGQLTWDMSRPKRQQQCVLLKRLSSALVSMKYSEKN